MNVTASVSRARPGKGGRRAGPYLVQILSARRPLDSSRRLDLSSFRAVELGRGASGDAAVAGGDTLRVDIGDPGVSTVHAHLEREGGGWAIRDGESKNGTLVGGAPITRAALADGDLIELGSTFFLYRAERRLGDASDEAAGDGPVELPGLEPSLRTFHPELGQLFEVLARVGESSLPLLVLGETGTGKELVARSIHEASRGNGPFVAVNCATLPPNLVESELFGAKRGAFSGADEDRLGHIRAAHGGTLFLDEIAELREGPQAALLRVLQAGEVVPLGTTRPVRVDVRVISATHADLAARCRHGAFRADLYARLAGYVAHLPPLRERREDLGLILQRMVAAGDLEDGFSFTRDAVRTLLTRRLSLNARELAHTLRAARLVAPGERLDTAHLAAEPLTGSDARAPEAGDRREELIALLTRHRGNLSAVTRELGTSRTQVQRLLERFDLDKEAYR